ncbi:uncharacterized protein RAG0_17029 [Rhynchosporium agropyri]|uniref:SET domain-containing protein n=1 Tax=Rhynchosporium agropyri TaxID=914238 RepID=A0A1E1LSQ2_9HELO|nr:uncharacterized protein RAG0_17029 [Rhynchosporium agropyri]
MNVLLYLFITVLSGGPVHASVPEVPLLAKSTGTQAAPLPADTSCPASQDNYSNLLHTIQPEQGITCPVEYDFGYSNGIPSIASSSSPQCIAVPGSSSSYCVFAFPEFAQGRGFVIIASPWIAPAIESAAATFRPSVKANDHEYFYEKPLPGRGIGLISNHTFRKGDLIMAATPLLLVQEHALSELPEAERHQIQQLAIAALPLHAKFGSNKEGFGIVVPEAARLNHDCRPNARFAFDTSTLSHKVHAARDIMPGEELTFSYLDEKQTYSARQEQLEAHWGFKCGCKLCSASEDLRDLSDRRLRRISVLRKTLFSFTPENFETITPELVLELVSLYESEGLHGAMAEAYMVTSFWYCIWGDILETKKWAALASKNWLVVDLVVARSWGEKPTADEVPDSSARRSLVLGSEKEVGNVVGDARENNFGKVLVKYIRNVT